jgi:hypothetical protein
VGRRSADSGALLAEGKRLAANRTLRLAPAARRQLASGEVDGRVVAALRLLLDRHMVRVISFGDRKLGAPRRTITIDCIDQRPIDVRSTQTAAVLAFLGEFSPELAPRSVRVTTFGKTTVIVATYPEAAG